MFALALREVHVLILERPGWALTRIAAERAITARGWRVASSPGAADALLCCGEPGSDLDPLVDRLFTQLPRPRTRGQVDNPVGVDAALDQIKATLIMEDGSPAGTENEPASARNADYTTSTMDHAGIDHANMDHANMDHANMDHAGMDHAGMDHAGMDHANMDHANMDHAGMDHAGIDHANMSGPGGIPLAGGAPDRDGLEMDVLPVRLGPVLPAWPAGLVLSVTLAGDLISECEVSSVGLDSTDTMPPQLSRHQVAALTADRIGWLLTLAGADRAQRQLRRVRDSLLDGGDIPGCAVQLRRLTSRLSRSRALRWSLRDLGRIHEDTLTRIDERHDRSGDVLDRLQRRLCELSETVEELTKPAAPFDVATGRLVDLEALDLVVGAVLGLDLGAARLVIASFDIELAAAGDNSRTSATPGLKESS